MQKKDENKLRNRDRNSEAADVRDAAADEAAEADKCANKSKATFKRLTLGSLLLFLFMLLYIPSLLNWLSGDSITQDVIRMGIIEESINVDGIIVRDEELIKPLGHEGRYIAEIGEGEKTSAYSRIAIVLNNQSDTLLQEIEEINAKIVKARMEKAEKTDFFSEDLAKLDDAIGIQVQNMIMACNVLSFEDIGRYRTEIGKIVEKQAEIVGENSADSYLNSLKQQKENLQKKLNMNTLEIVSSISGIVSYTIDGYETVLKPKSIATLTPKQLDSIRAKSLLQQEKENRAYAGKPLAKIIKGTDIYIAAAINAESAQSFKIGDKIKMRMNDTELETAGVITNINAPEDGRILIAVRVSRGADVLSARREVNVDLIKKTEEGLKIPLKCLRDFSSDGKMAKIMLIKYNVSSFRMVEIICKDAEYAIIRTPEKEFKKTVNLYDTYIMNPDNIKEGDIIEK